MRGKYFAPVWEVFSPASRTVFGESIDLHFPRDSEVGCWNCGEGAYEAGLVSGAWKSWIPSDVQGYSTGVSICFQCENPKLLNIFFRLFSWILQTIPLKKSIRQKPCLTASAETERSSPMFLSWPVVNNSSVAGLEEVGHTEDSYSMASSLLHPELWYWLEIVLHLLTCDATIATLSPNCHLFRLLTILVTP